MFRSCTKTDKWGTIMMSCYNSNHNLSISLYNVKIMAYHHLSNVEKLSFHFL